MTASVWRGHISFGLVTIPVRLYRAARRERVKLREVYTVQGPADWEEEAEAPEALPARTSTPHLAEKVQPKPGMIEEPPVAPVRRMAVEDSGRMLPSVDPVYFDSAKEPGDAEEADCSGEIPTESIFGT